MKLSAKLLGLAALALVGQLRAEDPKPKFPLVGSNGPGGPFTISRDCPGGTNDKPNTQTGAKGMCTLTQGTSLFQVFLCHATDCDGNDFVFGSIALSSGNFNCGDAIKKCAAAFVAASKGGVIAEREFLGGELGKACNAIPATGIKKDADKKTVTHKVATATCACKDQTGKPVVPAVRTNIWVEGNATQ